MVQTSYRLLSDFWSEVRSFVLKVRRSKDFSEKRLNFPGCFRKIPFFRLKSKDACKQIPVNFISSAREGISNDHHVIVSHLRHKFSMVCVWSMVWFYIALQSRFFSEHVSHPSWSKREKVKNQLSVLASEYSFYSLLSRIASKKSQSRELLSLVFKVNTLFLLP